MANFNDLACFLHRRYVGAVFRFLPNRPDTALHSMNTPNDQHSSIRTTATVVLLVFSLALGVRLAYQSQTQPKPPVLRGDSAAYFYYGYNLARYDVFSKQGDTPTPAPDAYRSPGYPIMLSGAMIFFGITDFLESYGTIQAWVGALAAGLTVLLGRIFLPSWAAIAAGLLVALSPHLVAMTPLLLTETLCGTVLVAAFLFFCHAIRSPNRILWAVAGVVFGFGYLVNQVLLPIPILVLVTVAWFCREIRRMIRLDWPR